MKTRVENYSEGFVAGFTSCEYRIWQSEDWREGWIQGTVAKVKWRLNFQQVMKDLALRPEKESGI